MNRRVTDSDPRNRPTRAQRKAELIVTLEQQRIDLLVEAERWQGASATLDSRWHQLARYRGWLYLAGGALLANSARHPRPLIRIAKRVAAGGLLLNRARRLLQQLR